MVQANRGAGPALGRSASTATSSSSTSLSSRAPPASAFSKKAPLPPPSLGFSQNPPPPYSAASNVDGHMGTAAATKRAPPPPPPLKPKPKPAEPPVRYVVALYDFEAQADGDLSFHTGDRIEIIEQTESAEDWWTGRLNGQQGIFPGT